MDSSATLYICFYFLHKLLPLLADGCLQGVIHSSSLRYQSWEVNHLLEVSSSPKLLSVYQGLYLDGCG